MKILDCDYFVVGSGMSGLMSALHLASAGRVVLATKRRLEDCNTNFAQGGICCVADPADTFAAHVQDTLIAGAGLCDEKVVRRIVSEAPAGIRDLIDCGVRFAKKEDGSWDLGREGGHSMRRIFHAGDITGQKCEAAMIRTLKRHPAIDVRERTMVIDLVTTRRLGIPGHSRCVGAYVLDTETGEIYAVRAPNTVLATGGCGKVYLYTCNPDIATGDGVALAWRAGARIANMEFVQFHPTCLYHPKAKRFLISEAVRGEGGLLKNSKGERFMLGKHELNELAPRDIVARFIYKELQESGEDHCFVDITAKSAEFLEHRFPTIFNECLRRGIDISKDWIPVCPVQHYMIGGVKTDLYARTAVPGLYAVGEAASTGVHGANRLASNSMLECLVFGRRAAVDINDRLGLTVARDFPVPEFPEQGPAAETPDYAEIRHEIQTLMSTYGFVVRSTAGMEKALARIRELQKALSPALPRSRELSEAINIAAVAESILTAALARKESVGAHYRVD